MANNDSNCACSSADKGALAAVLAVAVAGGFTAGALGQKIKAAATNRAAPAPAATGHQDLLGTSFSSSSLSSWLSSEVEASGARVPSLLNDCITVLKLRSWAEGSGKSVKSGRGSEVFPIGVAARGSSISISAPAFSKAAKYLRALASSRLFLMVTGLPLNKESRRAASSIRNS